MSSPLRYRVLVESENFNYLVALTGHFWYCSIVVYLRSWYSSALVYWLSVRTCNAGIFTANPSRFHNELSVDNGTGKKLIKSNPPEKISEPTSVLCSARHGVWYTIFDMGDVRIK